MQPSRGRPDVLGDRGRERDHVVLGDLFDLLDARDVEAGAARSSRAASAGTMPASAIASAAAISCQPGFVAALIAPDRAHFGICVARNHRPGVPVDRELAALSSCVARQ